MPLTVFAMPLIEQNVNSTVLKPCISPACPLSQVIKSKVKSGLHMADYPFRGRSEPGGSLARATTFIQRMLILKKVVNFSQTKKSFTSHQIKSMNTLLMRLLTLTIKIARQKLRTTCVKDSDGSRTKIQFYRELSPWVLIRSNN